MSLTAAAVSLTAAVWIQAASGEDHQEPVSLEDVAPGAEALLSEPTLQTPVLLESHAIEQLRSAGHVLTRGLLSTQEVSRYSARLTLFC